MAEAAAKELESKCKCPGFLKRCEDDHNSCLDKVGLGEKYALCLLILSFIFMGPLSRFCYMCCSKQENSPRWIWKDWIWLNIWMGLTYCVLIGWFWDIVFCLHAYKKCKGKDVKTCENCC